MDAARILLAEPASSHFLADGVAAAVHHAARSIKPPQTSRGLLPNIGASDASDSFGGESSRHFLDRREFLRDVCDAAVRAEGSGALHALDGQATSSDPRPRPARLHGAGAGAAPTRSSRRWSRREQRAYIEP